MVVRDDDDDTTLMIKLDDGWIMGVVSELEDCG